MRNLIFIYKFTFRYFYQLSLGFHFFAVDYLRLALFFPGLSDCFLQLGNFGLFLLQLVSKSGCDLISGSQLKILIQYKL